MAPRSKFTLLGFSLLIVGTVLALTSYLVLRYVSLTALGASALILAAVSLALGRGEPKVPLDIGGMLLDSGLKNTSVLIKELGLSPKAIYLPSSLAGGKPRALLPLLPTTRTVHGTPLPNNLIVRYGPHPTEIGVLVTAPGSLAVEHFGPVKRGENLEDALTSIIVGQADIADGIKAVETGGSIMVEVANPRIEHENMKIFEFTGTPLASIVASIVAEEKSAPMEIAREERRGSRHIVEITLARRLP